MEFNGRLLKILFDFGFGLFFTPFRFTLKRDGDPNNRHQIQRMRPQQVICGIGQLLATFAFLGEAIENLGKISTVKNNPVVYFNAFYGITNLLMSMTGTWFVWRKQRFVQRIANEVDVAFDVSYGLKTLLTTLTIFLCLMATVMSIASAVLGSTVVPIWRWSPETLWKRLIIVSRSYYLGYEKLANNATEPAISSFPLGQQILGGVFALATIFKWIQKLFLELTLLIGILSFWMMSYSFSRFIEMSQSLGVDPDWDVIARKHKSLKSFSKRFNRTFGGLIFIYVWNSLLVCATRLDTIFTNKDEFFRWRGLMYMYVMVGAIFIMSADCSRQAQNVSIWLSNKKNSEQIDSDSALSYLVNDISRNTIAVSGLRIFSITYGFVANVTGIVVTYFIICVQSRDGKIVSE